ncbi:hypothetical protein [Streptomyces sp. NPDC052496]|uniref:hypothetical protein n=1 Tax=Streptomyces sp. NPDC052496 TaxID=3154951 RepID=UPI00343C0ACA
MTSWWSVTENVDTTALDCVQANIAVLADRVHGGGTHLRLGAPLRFRPNTSTATSLPTVEPSLDHHVSDAEILTGIRLRGMNEPISVDRACRLLDSVNSSLPHVLYVVADAYTLPWCPYVGHVHMDHSFLLLRRDEAHVDVLDAYHNDTPYGPARPDIRAIGREELQERLAEQPLRVAEVGTATPQRHSLAHTLQRNASALSTAEHDIRAYAQAYRDHADPATAAEALLLESWLLARSRRMHARWLSHSLPAEVCAPFSRHADAWSAFAGHCYMAARRLRRGSTPPDGVHEQLSALLHEDIRQAERLAEAPSASTTAA